MPGQTKLSRKLLYRELLNRLIAWIPASGYRGIKYETTYSAAFRRIDPLFSDEVADILTWMSRNDYIEVISLKTPYIQIFPKFRNDMAVNFEVWLKQKTGPEGTGKRKKKPEIGYAEA